MQKKKQQKYRKTKNNKTLEFSYKNTFFDYKPSLFRF